MSEQLRQTSNDPTAENALDAIRIVADSLENRLKPLGKIDLSIRFSAIEQRRKTRLNAPFILRSLVDGDWQTNQVDEMCGAMREVGGAVIAESKTLNQVSINHIPFRVSPVFIDSFPDSTELESADVVELQMLARDEVSQRLNSHLAAWPCDVVDVERLAKKIEVMRQLAGPTIPVGVAIPIGDIQADVTLLIKCGVDFVSIINSTGDRANEFPDAWIAVTARAAATEAGCPQLPIFLMASLRNGWDIAKLTALGISGFIVDSLVVPKELQASQAADPLSYSMLSDITRSIVPHDVVESAEDVLKRFVRELNSLLPVCGQESLEGLDAKQLIATTSHAHQLTGVRQARHGGV